MSEDRVWHAIQNGLVGHSPRHAEPWTKICCPMCPMRGETPDKKYRCGITNHYGFAFVKCFNCKFKTAFKMGHHLGSKMKDFLRALGVGEREITRLAFWAEQLHRQQPDAVARSPQIIPKFAKTHLPDGAKSLQRWIDMGCDDPHYNNAVQYLLSRGDVAATATTYYWTPSRQHQLHRRLIIPCYHDGQLVGWTARSVDDLRPRYHKELSSNFLFNTHLLRGTHRYVFIVEGVFDALTIDGVGALGGTLNGQQIAWINQRDKRPIVVPDRDAAGNYLIETAIQQNWAVAFPHCGRHQWWEADIRDAADAVQRYGKLYATQSILATQESDPRKIKQRVTYRLG